MTPLRVATEALPPLPITPDQPKKHLMVDNEQGRNQEHPPLTTAAGAPVVNN